MLVGSRFTRTTFVALAVVTITVGLAVHWHGGFLSPEIRDILGDVLWATMMTWWLGALLPAAPPVRRATIALAISWADEFSQMYHSPAIDAIRSTTLGHLVLGTDFDARDLASYGLGVVVALVLEYAMRRRGMSPATKEQ